MENHLTSPHSYLLIIMTVLLCKVETMQQLRQVEEQDLEDIRMRSDDIAKLKKNIKKEFPQSAFGKLKKVPIVWCLWVI